MPMRCARRGKKRGHRRPGRKVRPSGSKPSCAIMKWRRSRPRQDWAEILKRPQGHRVSIDGAGTRRGLRDDDLAIIAEQDILGDRLVRRGRKARKASDFISELSALTPGDLVVHVDHGLGRFEGLKTIEVQGAPHDCLFIMYAGNDRLFLPVENIELLSRYGADEEGAQLDRLGGGAWQAKKAKLKERIREIAENLIKTAAARELQTGRGPAAARRRSMTNSARDFPMRRRKTSSPPSRRHSKTCKRAGRWTGSSAAMSVSARRKWRCARPSSRR